MKVFNTWMVRASLMMMPGVVSAQDVHFGQFFNAPLVLNPANAGDVEGDQRLSLIHREQWRSVGAAFRTDAFSYDLPLFRGRMRGRYLGVGLSAFSDKAGSTAFGDTQGSLSLSYAIRGGESSLLAFGLQGTYGQRSAVLDGMRWDSQYNGAGFDPSLPTGESIPNSRATFVDFGAGALMKGELKSGTQWKGGVSVFHLNEPVVSLFGTSEDRMLRRFNVHGELRIDGKKWSWLPKFFVAEQGGSREINVGGLMHRRIGIDSRYTTDKNSSGLYFGCFYRVNDALVPTVQFEWKRKLVAAVSYDVNVSRLRAQTAYRGGAEISLQWIGVMSEHRRQLPRAKAH